MTNPIESIVRLLEAEPRLDPNFKRGLRRTLGRVCPICAGEGEVQIYSATDGTQTEYTTRCPRCLGFGKVQEDRSDEDD